MYLTGVHYAGKNLFDYAIKELSQDAFILWLFDSRNSDNEIERTTAVANVL